MTTVVSAIAPSLPAAPAAPRAPIAPGAASRRHNVTVSGNPDGPPILFAHGFGCDQSMWRAVARGFEASHKVILFDYVGFGGSDAGAYDAARYGSLEDYASAVLEICAELELEDVLFVGHSVSAMIGVLAVNRQPERFASLVLVAPSPRYIDDGPYRGGFTREDITGLLATMDTDHLGWSSTMAPIIMGRPDAPEFGEELTAAFCSVDPVIARDFARLTFLSDNRADLAAVSVPTLVLQCADDVIAPAEVVRFVHTSIPGSVLVELDARGHCPNVSAPAETERAIRAFIA